MEQISVSERFLLQLMNIIGWTWHYASFLPWYFISGNYKKPHIGQVQATSITGKPGGPYRNVNNLDQLEVGFKGETTLDKVFKNIVDVWGNRKAFGTREVLSEEDETQPDGRIFKKQIRGEYHWMSYKEAYEEMQIVSAGLAGVGIKPQDKVIIFAATKVEWMLSCLGCFQRNFTVATAYTHLEHEALKHLFAEVEAPLVITDGDCLDRVEKILEAAPSIKVVVYFGAADKSQVERMNKRAKVYSYSHLKDLGRNPENAAIPIEAPRGEDMAVIMYTSGSTGKPKGVMVSHQNITTTIGGFSKAAEFTRSDILVAYLPLAHILEMGGEILALAHGTKVGYSSPLTLTANSAKIKKGSVGDLALLKPTIMACVPMVMDRIRKEVTNKVHESSRTMQLLFKFAYKYKSMQLRRGYGTPILDRLIFKRIREILGGQLKYIMSGGVPLSPATEEFINICMCCSVGQGYALTETVGCGTVSQEWDTSYGRVGAPLSVTDIKLVDWKEGSYSVNDKPYPRGEIAICSAGVSMGYFKQDHLTNEVFIRESDGRRWFYTGDIGEIHKDGVLKIIDRKKDLAKLSHGEYVSLGTVESVLKLSVYCDNCCAYGNGLESYLVALIVPNQIQLKRIANQHGIIGSHEQLCRNEQIIGEVLMDLQDTGKKHGLNKSEVPRKIHLCETEWLPETNLVTASFKLRRKPLQSKYQVELDRLYQK